LDSIATNHPAAPGHSRSLNRRRDTPGRLLVAFSLAFSAVVVFSWRVQSHRVRFEWMEYPTALGDRDYYQPDPGKGLGASDFHEPNLKFDLEGREISLYRRLHQPAIRPDARMRKVARDKTGRHFVYVDQNAKPDSAPRFYLKAAEDAYIEFGAKRFFQTFEESRQSGQP
jgi:hypothetical protein